MTVAAPAGTHPLVVGRLPLQQLPSLSTTCPTQKLRAPAAGTAAASGTTLVVGAEDVSWLTDDISASVVFMALYVSFGQGSSLFWTHTLRAL